MGKAWVTAFALVQLQVSTPIKVSTRGPARQQTVLLHGSTLEVNKTPKWWDCAKGLASGLWTLFHLAGKSCVSQDKSHMENLQDDLQDGLWEYRFNFVEMRVNWLSLLLGYSTKLLVPSTAQLKTYSPVLHYTIGH